MKITKVNLEHFKGVEQASINFGDLTVITGKNSSGKSSVIQSLKYLTQWFKRIQTTRGLNEFSAPSMQVIHPDFITENKDYESIRNSKSPNSAGVGLGVDLNKTNNQFFMNSDGQYSIYAQFENVSQEGNKVRPKSFYLSLPEHWNEVRENFTDEKYEVIYHNTSIPQLNTRKDKYIEMYGNGLLLDRIINDEEYINSSNYLLFKDKSKNIYLHNAYEGVFGGNSQISHLINPAIDLIVKKLQNIQVDKDNASEVDKEKAIIINSVNERLSFESTNRLKINKYQGTKNVYFDIFENYVLDSMKNKDYSRSTDIDESALETLFDNVLQIYHSDIKYKSLLSDYLQFDVTSEQEFIDWENPTTAAKLSDPNIKTLNYDFLTDKKVPANIMESFKSITDIVNSSDFPDTAIGSVQILLMYVDYVNKLAKNNNALQLSRYMVELVNNNHIFEPETMPQSAYKKPIEAIVAIQNCLGESSEYIGYQWTEKGTMLAFGQQESCTCRARNAYNFMSPEQELIKELHPWEIVRDCPDGLNLNSHIYTLTAHDEIASGEPNAYTLRPKANIRGSLMGAEYFLDILKKLLCKQNIESFELYFGMLNDDYFKDKEAFKESLKYFDNDQNYSEVRSEILRIEELIKEYANEREEAYEEYADLTSRLKQTREDKKQIARLEELSEDTEWLSSYVDEEEVQDEVETNERIDYELTLIETQIETLLDLKKHWDKKIEDLSLEKEKLLNKLHELDVEKEDFEDAPWNLQLVKKIQTIVNTNYVSTKPESVGVDIDSMSVDMKYLNTGRNPSSEDRPGEFFDNLPVGKIGGRLTDLMYEEGKTKIYPYLYPSVKDFDETDYEFSRRFEDLDWHTIQPKDEQFVTSFNMWISYLSMEVSKVSSKIEGPKPRLKVTGKDGEERDVFEVGSGIGQVLPVIAICLLAKPGEVVCIEEPEAHLHPSAQAYLADFLISMAASGRQIIVETHSPNIIDRLRLRRVHQSWKKFKNSDWIKNELYLDDVQNIEKKYSKFTEPDIKIIFAEQNDEGYSSYKEANIDNKGDIIFGQSQDEIWPEGFFDNAQQELTYILQARIKSEEE